MALAEMIATLPGRISSASALQRALNIDMKLGWKVFRIIDTEDPLALAQPSRAAWAGVGTDSKDRGLL